MYLLGPALYKIGGMGILSHSASQEGIEINPMLSAVTTMALASSEEDFYLQPISNFTV